jgi:hypothetical protein
MAALVAAIHVFRTSVKTWMPAKANEVTPFFEQLWPGMTDGNYKSRTSRAGSSRLSFTRTRKVTASRPSTRR